jgi:hypothetical protein
MLESFTLATFSGRLGDTFQVTPGVGPPVDLELVEVSACRAGGVRTGRSEPFSLIFRGPRVPALPQQTYPMIHEAIGAFDLFIVPLGPDQQGMLYEAVFG